jgi:hypothetical protein
MMLHDEGLRNYRKVSKCLLMLVSLMGLVLFLILMVMIERKEGEIVCARYRACFWWLSVGWIILSAIQLVMSYFCLRGVGETETLVFAVVLIGVNSFVSALWIFTYVGAGTCVGSFAGSLEVVAFSLSPIFQIFVPLVLTMV